MGKMKDSMALTPHTPMAPGPAPMPTIPTDEDAAWQAFDNEAGADIPPLIFYKKGRWVCRDKETNKDVEIPLGTKFLADVPNTMRGWVRFIEGASPDYSRVHRIGAGMPVEARETLGFTDQSYWKRNKKGEPIDPCVLRYYLPMWDKDGNLFAWAFNSKGADKAFRKLRDYCRKNVTGKLPVVSLQSDGYDDPQWGWIPVPVLKPAGLWRDRPASQASGGNGAVSDDETPDYDDDAVSQAPTKKPKNADMDDEIPF